MNSRIWARCVVFMLVLLLLIWQVAFAENSSQLNASEVLTHTRLMLTVVITLIGSIVIGIWMYNISKNKNK